MRGADFVPLARGVLRCEGAHELFERVVPPGGA
jgi:hypothetical protein